jgi:hypothetical protein
MAVGKFTQVFGQSDVWGGKQFVVGDYVGPTSYVSGSTGGDTILPGTLGFFNSILTFLEISIDTTGVYYAQAQSTGTGLIGAGRWRLRWYTAATGAEVSNATNLSAISIKMSAVGF